jgi:hypothetical protein
MANHKAPEPRVLIKVAESQRERIRKNANRQHLTMINYVESLLANGETL